MVARDSLPRARFCCAYGRRAGAAIPMKTYRWIDRYIFNDFVALSGIDDSYDRARQRATRSRDETTKIKVRARSRAYYAKSRQKFRDFAKAHYVLPRDRVLARNKEWRTNNRQLVAAINKKWRAANKERLRISRKKWYYENLERAHARANRWTERNRERLRASQRETASLRRNLLTDDYIRNLLGLRKEIAPKSLIEVKRLH